MTYSQRIKRIFSQVENSVDAILLRNSSDPFIDPTFFYVTGIKKGLFEGCSILLRSDGSSHLLVSTLEEPLVPTHQKYSCFSTKKEYTNLIHDLTQNNDIIGINTAMTLYDDYQQMKELFSEKTLVSISQAVTNARTIKDEEELNRIREACLIADKVMKKIPSFFSFPLTEHELAATIDHELKLEGASDSAFETISSFGTNTAKPHYTSGHKQIEPGNFIICDFGATVDHYHSDTTRTFVYGKPSKKQKQIHQTVLSAQQQALNHIRPGVAASSIHQIADDTINATPFKGYFLHSTGHGLGLNVHDPGIGLAPHYQNKLQPGMVLTVEPGIYIPDFGGVRIEDDIVVSPDGHIQLTQSPKELIEIPSS